MAAPEMARTQKLTWLPCAVALMTTSWQHHALAAPDGDEVGSAVEQEPSEPEAAAETEAAAKLEPAAESEPKPAPDVEAASETESESAAWTESEGAAETESESAPEPEAEAETEVETAFAIEAEAQPAAPSDESEDKPSKKERSSEADEAFKIPPPPPGFDFKRPLTPEDYKRKHEGGYFTGLPLANFDPNTGAGFGARAYYYFNGRSDNPLFGYTPYLHRLFIQGFATTKGLQFHWLDWDAPAIFGSAFRVRSQSVWYRNTSQHYYGLGTASMDALTFTGAGQSYDTFAEYNSDLRAVRPDGTTLSRYDHVDLMRPISLLSIERTFFNGLIRPLVGVAISHATIRDFTGRQVSADDENGGETEAEMGTTRYEEDCATLIGCEGGWDNYLRLGVSFDTRDFEPDPNSGAFVDAALDLGSAALGSEYDYARFLVAARYFWSPMPEVTDLVLAGRATFMAQTPGTPWFSQSTLPYTEDTRTGLGGLRTLRGYQQDRFVGQIVTLTNFEARWNFYRFHLGSEKFGLFLVPFLDMGRVYDNAKEVSFKNWARAQGAGFRISWNMATIISADYGFSEEDSGLYINFNHQF